MTKNTVIIADVNVLIYAFDEQARRHEQYRNWVTSVLVDGETCGLVDTVLAGFVRIVTNPLTFSDPTPTPHALEFVEALISAPSATWLHSNRPVWDRLALFAAHDAGIKGTVVPDAYLAAVAVSNGARLATADRGFSRYPNLDWFDPGA
jgi:toxin-antitoxin system PIN domain toxin